MDGTARAMFCSGRGKGRERPSLQGHRGPGAFTEGGVPGILLAEWLAEGGGPSWFSLPPPGPHCCPKTPRPPLHFLLAVPAPGSPHLLAFSAACSEGSLKLPWEGDQNNGFSALLALRPSSQGRVSGLFSFLGVPQALRSGAGHIVGSHRTC